MPPARYALRCGMLCRVDVAGELSPLGRSASAIMENEDNNPILLVNGQEHSLACADDLVQHLSAIQQAEFTEVWLNRGGETTSMLTNRKHNRAFLMFLTDDNPTGFHAISRNETEPDEAIDFLLDNGQVDEIEYSDTVSLSDASRALKHFFTYGGMASFILWHDDSQ